MKRSHPPSRRTREPRHPVRRRHRRPPAPRVVAGRRRDRLFVELVGRESVAAGALVAILCIIAYVATHAQ